MTSLDRFQGGSRLAKLSGPARTFSAQNSFGTGTDQHTARSMSSIVVHEPDTDHESLREANFPYDAWLGTWKIVRLLPARFCRTLTVSAGGIHYTDVEGEEEVRAFALLCLR